MEEYVAYKIDMFLENVNELKIPTLFGEAQVSFQ